MSFRLVRGSPVRIRMAFMLSAVVLSMWISNTATAAILIPILLGTLPDDDEHATGSVLAIAYAASVGGMGTLIGSPPNFITVRFLQEQAGVEFDFVHWMGIGIPIGAGLGRGHRLRPSMAGPAAARGVQRHPRRLTLVMGRKSHGRLLRAGRRRLDDSRESCAP